jgi:uncharacterized membrane protein YeaQ/YmgE (transglycosylase-associated protein family)
MLRALLVGFVAGVIARVLLPFDVVRKMRGPGSWGVSILIGLAGAIVGWLIVTAGFGSGDTDVFDWGGIVGALTVLPLVNWYVHRSRVHPGPVT